MDKQSFINKMTEEGCCTEDEAKLLYSFVDCLKALNADFSPSTIEEAHEILTSCIMMGKYTALNYATKIWRQHMVIDFIPDNLWKKIPYGRIVVSEYVRQILVIYRYLVHSNQVSRTFTDFDDEGWRAIMFEFERSPQCPSSILAVLKDFFGASCSTNISPTMLYPRVVVSFLKHIEESDNAQIS